MGNESKEVGRGRQHLQSHRAVKARAGSWDFILVAVVF